ncbi:MAG: hypothetical protein V4538_10615 [Bacteroidota bacterium]
MKKILIIFLAFIACTAACKKEETSTDSSTDFKDAIILNEPKIYGDSVVVLTWSIKDRSKFKSIVIIRNDNINNAPPSFIGVSLDSSQYIDTLIPYCPRFDYNIRGYIKGTNSQFYFSNSYYFFDNEISKFEIKPTNILHDKENKFIYFFESNGNISLYDIAKKAIIKTVTIGNGNGNCDFGYYNGVQELYIPDDNGWLYVYDAQNLTEITKFNVGNSLTSVVENNNILFISNTLGFDNSLIAFDRATGKNISTQVTDKIVCLKKVSNTQTNLWALCESSWNNFSYFQYNNQNNPINSPNQLSLTFPADIFTFPFESSPQGNYMLFSSGGNIITQDYIIKYNLPKGNYKFSSFTIDKENNRILGTTSSKTIEVYDATTFKFIKSIRTKTYPMHVVIQNNRLICVGSLVNLTQDNYSNTDKITVEELKY